MKQAREQLDGRGRKVSVEYVFAEQRKTKRHMTEKKWSTEHDKKKREERQVVKHRKAN